MKDIDSIAFPAGSRLLAKITPLERERNVFIIGHRLEPYRAADIAPWDVKLSTESVETLSSRLIPIALDDAAVFFTLFGHEEFFYLLAAQDDTNAKTLAKAPPESRDVIVRITAFDMHGFYDTTQLSAGDYLDIEVTDTSGACFIARPLTADSILPQQRAAWFRALDRGREAALRELSHPVDPLVFIHEVFSSAPASARKEPAASFSEYFNGSNTLEIKSFGGRSFMWEKGYDIPALLLDGKIESEDDLDELSATLADNGFALDSTEVAAFVRDALSRGAGVEEALGRCFAGADKLGMPKKKLDDLIGKARGFGMNIARDWDGAREDPEAVRMRSLLLDIYSPFLLWMRKIGGIVSSPEQLDTAEFNALSEAMQNVCELLHLVADGELDDPDSCSKFIEQAPTLAKMTRELMDSVEAGILEARGKRKASSAAPKKKKGKKRPASARMFVFEARIADIEPPIRRRIVVPGNRSLGDLHAILQEAFGWTDSHLHFFRFRGEVFGAPSPDDFEPLADEGKIRLDDLGLRARSKIEYVYDYGDNWEHELVVAMTRKAGPGFDESPFCLEGERAAPPEDCGGAPGYAELIIALKKPAAKRTKDDRERLKWLGEEWDSERCDLEWINERLEPL